MTVVVVWIAFAVNFFWTLAKRNGRRTFLLGLLGVAAATVAPVEGIALAGRGDVASTDTGAGAPVGAALIVFIALLSTAGGLVFVGRKRGERAAEPAVVPIGVAPVADSLPVSDPLLAALQGSARFAPPDGTATGSHPARPRGDAQTIHQ